jgi:hypothetical protein
MIIRAKTVNDLFLKVLLFAAGGILILRRISSDSALALSILLYPSLILALITFVMLRYFKETIDWQSPSSRFAPCSSARPLYSLHRFFNWKMYAYISLLSPIVVLSGYKKYLLT